MELNNEGVISRGGNPDTNTKENSQNSNNQFTFQKQRSIGNLSKSSQKRLEERERKHIKGHLFFEPAWNNSFGLEKPYYALLALILLLGYLYLAIFYTHNFKNDESRLVFGFIIVGFYIWECCRNDVVGYLTNQMSLSELLKYLDELKAKNIQLKFEVSAYHNERYNPGFSSKTRTRQVTTYKETFEFPIGQYFDQTEDSIAFFEKAKYFRIHSFVSYSFGNQESESYYDEMVKYARNKSKNKDTYQTEKELQNCQGMKTNILAYSDSTKIDPMLSIFVYIVYCLLGMSLLYRILLNRRVCFVEHSVHKQLFLDQSKMDIEIIGPFLLSQNKDNQMKIFQNQQIIMNQYEQILKNQSKDNPILQNKPEDISNNSNTKQQQGSTPTIN